MEIGVTFSEESEVVYKPLGPIFSFKIRLKDVLFCLTEPRGFFFIRADPLGTLAHYLTHT